MREYDPATFRAQTFFDAAEAFRSGADSPRAYLERCLDVIEQREGIVKAFVTLNRDGARAAADASSARWEDGKPLSPIDGLPIGIKDLLETRDMPTELGCKAYAGHFPKRDNAAVWALREAGAVIVGKTVTAELGGSEPGPTTNPFDVTRTPGGSSSGSAAAVAAGMLPAAIGTQVGGSIIRPAAFCGNYALKPSQGGINRGERLATSMSTHGVHAGCIEDVWRVAIEIASRAGGDRGYPGLLGPSAPPAPDKPGRLIVLETEGWPEIDAATRDLFRAWLGPLSAEGVQLLDRSDHPLIESLELSLREARRVAGRITIWENRWAQRNLVNEHPDGVSERTRAGLTLAERMTPEDYRSLLAERELAQTAHRLAAGLADAIVMLSCPGPAPLWAGDVPGEALARNPTGDFVFNAPSSLLFAPAVTLPKLALDGMPVGVQLVGLPQEDARMTAMARWVDGAIAPLAR